MEIIADAIPSTLKSTPHWVLWRTRHGKKPPYSVHTGRAVDITKPGAGATFEQAWHTLLSSDRFEGLGYILSGDGLVGIDIDDCLSDPHATADALEFLDAVGCQYIEISPSGQGLHGLGFDQTANLPATGWFKSAKVEIYANKRYLTVTGQLLPVLSGNGHLQVMPHLAQCVKKLVRTPPTQVTQVIQETQVTQGTHGSQAGGLDIPVCNLLNGLPGSCIPTGFGTRNRTIFHFARYLAGLVPNAKDDQLYTYFVAWFETHKQQFRTQDMGISWADFLSAREAVRSPYGTTLQAALAKPQAIPMWMQTHRFGQRANRLLGLCVTLAHHHAPHPFFLSARQAGQLVGMDFSDCAKLLQRFVRAGYLTVAATSTRTTATSYLLGREPAD